MLQARYPQWSIWIEIRSWHRELQWSARNWRRRVSTNLLSTRASRSSPRVVAERWGYHSLDLLKEVPDMLSLIVVDLRSGRRIASVKPRPPRNYSSGGIWDGYFQYAVSPDGGFLTEGGDGTLKLYLIQ
jgi:hypothetical protein